MGAEKAKAAAKAKAKKAAAAAAAARAQMLSAQKGLNASIARQAKLKYQTAKHRAAIKSIGVKAARIAAASALLEDAKLVVDSGVEHQASVTEEVKKAKGAVSKSDKASRIAHENYEQNL